MMIFLSISVVVFVWISNVALMMNTKLFYIGRNGTNQDSKAIVYALKNNPADETINIISWNCQLCMLWKNEPSPFEECDSTEGKTCQIVERHHYNKSEVIIFQGLYLDLSDMPTHRLPFQKWIFHEVETPPQTWHNKEFKSMESIAQAFNVTSTYSLDSDIPIYYQRKVCYVNQDKYKSLKEQSINYVARKTERVAWFVSHCDTQSRRELYVRELSKYIPVDIYGRCGNFTCGSKHTPAQCDKTLVGPQYKFYLSFENSFCKDYVTEKLWRFIEQPIPTIPVVMGAVNYTSILPSKTFINVKDFESPKKLAEYLRALSQDDDEFNEYIRRKNSLVCWTPAGRIANYPCSLCKFLHEHRFDTLHAPDILDFWSEKRRCTPPRFVKEFSHILT